MASEPELVIISIRRVRRRPKRVNESRKKKTKENKSRTVKNGLKIGEPNL